MLTTRAVCAAVFLSVSVLGSAQAQDGNSHRGFWIGFGLGAGWNTVPDDDTQAGGALYARLGGTLSQKWLLGGEAYGWGRRTEDAVLGADVTLSRGNASFIAMFYPSNSGGFYLKGGLGFSYVTRSADIEGLNISASSGALGTSFGLGYDIRLGSNIYLVPAFDWLFQAIEENDESENSSIFLISVGLIWH